MGSSYREFAPPPWLADRLVCLWVQTTGGADERHTVLPDTCADIVWVGERAPVVAGPATRSTIVPLPGDTTIVGARFTPGWAACSLRLDVDALRNTEVPLGDLWGRQAGRLTDRLRRGENAAARLRNLAAALGAQFDDADAADPLIRHGVAWLVRHPAARLHDLAGRNGLSERQLRRRFQAAVGYAPKTFQRIVRFQRALALSAAPANRDHGLAWLASAAGYADQPHMNREIRALSGRTAAAVLARGGSTLAMSDLFKSGDRDADYPPPVDH